MNGDEFARSNHLSGPSGLTSGTREYNHVHSLLLHVRISRGCSKSGYPAVSVASKPVSLVGTNRRENCTPKGIRERILHLIQL